MHALRQDQELRAVSRLALFSLVVCGSLASAGGGPGAVAGKPAEEPQATVPRPRTTDAAADEPEAGADRPSRGRRAAKGSEKDANEASTPGGDREETPKTMPLPSQGLYPATELVRLAGELLDRPTEISDTGVEEIRIEIIPHLAGQPVTIHELRLLLRFFGIYLFDSQDAEERAVLVASTTPNWHPRRPRYTHVLEVPALDFKRVWKRLETEIEAYNASRLEAEAKAQGIPVEAVGKIFLRTPNKKTLTRLVKLAGVEGSAGPPPDRQRLFAFIGRFRHVRALQDAVLERLSPGERVKTRFVIMRSGNRLLYRAPAPLGEKIADLLERLDRRF